MKRTKRVLEFTNSIITVATLGVIWVLLLRADGPIGGAYVKWREERRVNRLVRERWNELLQGPVIGDPAAPVKIIEFADFQCPFCARTNAALTEALKERKDVAIVYRHFPLTSIHPHANAAARAAVCADKMNRFREIHDYLFANKDWQNTPNWRLIATEINIDDTEAFLNCMQSAETMEHVARDSVLGRELGVRATPTYLFIGGFHVGGADRGALEAMFSKAAKMIKR